jgi:hypothetical protein
LVSNATFGSVTSVQLGGIAWVPVETQSDAVILLHLVIASRRAARDAVGTEVEVVELRVVLEKNFEEPPRSSVPGLTAIHDSE